MATVDKREDYFCLDGEDSHSNISCRTYGPNDDVHSLGWAKRCPTYELDKGHGSEYTGFH
jgi:hypothetical protein